MQPPTISPDIAALMSFVNGAPAADSPISGTAARMMAQQSASPVISGAAPADQPCAPLASDGRSLQHCTAIQTELLRHEATRSTNPLWGRQFLRRVALLDGQRTLELDMRRVLQGHGYVGSGTVTPPRSNLKTDLQRTIGAGSARPPIAKDSQGRKLSLIHI